MATVPRYLAFRERGAAMKAHRGEEIVCDCGRVGGSFRNDVADDASISSRDITISLPDVPDFLGRWLCPDCRLEVARFSGNHWRVLTRRGWL
jgi:hypothetical protein